MGVLKISIEVLDYMFTAVAMMFLSDIMYQLSFHLFHLYVVEEKAVMDCIWTFSPDMGKAKLLWAVLKRGLSYYT